MLVRLILLLLLAVGGFVAWRYGKSRRLTGRGGLDVFEIERLMKLAQRSERLKGAMMLRVNIVEAAPPDEKKAVSAKVDTILRRLAHVERLHDSVKKTLAANDQEKLKDRRAELLLEAEIIDDERAESKRLLVEQLGTQLEQLHQLHLREDELDESGHRILAGLNNLHLAMLNASSSEASLQNSAVATALEQLEDTSESFRQKTAAGEEVERLLKAATKGRIAAGR